jgi:hypothetical protein
MDVDWRKIEIRRQVMVVHLLDLFGACTTSNMALTLWLLVLSVNGYQRHPEP